jgi:hypothetical protein
MTKDEWYAQLFEHLDNSKFRSCFHLNQKEQLMAIRIEIINQIVYTAY